MPRARFVLWFSIGAGAGLAVFAGETLLIVRSGSAVLAWDQSGVAHAALEAAKPALENLVARIAVAYAVAGGILGLLTALLASGATRTRTGFVLLWTADAAALCLLLALRACIERPALFADADGPALHFILRHGAPWQPAAALVALLPA